MAENLWLTVADACRILKVSRRTLYNYMKAGLLPFYRAGGSGHRRIRPEDLERLMIPGALPNGRTADEVAGQPWLETSGGECLALIARLQEVELKLQKAERDLEELRPLRVWAGHPCYFCKEPLKGKVTPEVARELLKNLAHKECLEEHRRGGSFPITYTFFEPTLYEAE